MEQDDCRCDIDYIEERALCEAESRLIEVIKHRSPYCKRHNPSAYWLEEEITRK